MVFPDPCNVIAGSIHNNKHVWVKIIEESNSEVLNWVNNYVDIHDFMQPFKGMFWGVQYDDVYPPSRQFNNAGNCQEHIDFINDEITSRLQSGAGTLLGKVGEVQPPHIVSPITIEPTKPRLCINLMYLNSFMKDTPFNLDTLVDVPKTVRKGSFLTKLDDTSGYGNIFVTESSRHLLGFEWGGYFFSCNTLPFGWKNSASIYHTLNLQGISFIRSKSISCLLYIDDRLIEKFHGNLPNDLDIPAMRSHIALRYAVRLFISLGNTMLDEDGKSLPHFTPFPTPLSSGVDAFAQTYKEGEIYYAFPPFCMIPTVVNFILQERLSCTLVFPDFKPVQPWFPVVLAQASQLVTIGFKGGTGVLLYLSKKGFLSDKKGLQWNMLAASFSFDRVHEKN
ncbi:unnamed protein product [Mytilus coruscus]|uniref:Reverse transcriptase domain-containing protein n=1 Tax=Mytilus coruscus TaxID=42192 RepID=A0A6J7ZV40_MYTCO|nr:unnamed protein product [Mytilus coruscus]